MFILAKSCFYKARMLSLQLRRLRIRDHVIYLRIRSQNSLSPKCILFSLGHTSSMCFSQHTGKRGVGHTPFIKTTCVILFKIAPSVMVTRVPIINILSFRIYLCTDIIIVIMVDTTVIILSFDKNVKYSFLLGLQRYYI